MAMDSNEEKLVPEQGDAPLEPFVGMEFESEDAARDFYMEYAGRVGFVVRLMTKRYSDSDGRVLSRKLGCNKAGFSPGHGELGPDNKPKPCAREGCKAAILVKIDSATGKWVVKKFLKEHNHALVANAEGHRYRSVVYGDKDKKIELLTLQLKREEQQCEANRKRLYTFLDSILEQQDELSSKVQVTIKNVRRFESELQK